MPIGPSVQPLDRVTRVTRGEPTGGVAAGRDLGIRRVSYGVRTRRMMTLVEGGGSGVVMSVMAIEGADPAGWAACR